MKVEIQDVVVSFGQRTVLERVTLTIPAGKSVALVGQSGSGKTTLLRMLAGLGVPTKGTIRVDGRMPAEHFAGAKIGFLFQEACLFPHLSLRQNLEVPYVAHGMPVDHAEVERQLAAAGLKSAGEILPHQASVGMKARAAIARTLCLPPGLLLMDEPFAALDPVRRTELNRVIRRTCREIGATCIWATHHVVEALLYSDLIVALTPGGAIELFEAPGLPPETDESAIPESARILRDKIVATTWSRQDLP